MINIHTLYINKINDFDKKKIIVALTNVDIKVICWHTTDLYVIVKFSIAKIKNVDNNIF